MKVFFDSSALAKRYINEKGSDSVEQVCRNASTLGVSVLCCPEIVSALNRLVREKQLTRLEYDTLKTCLLSEINDAEVVNLVPGVIADSINILENNPVRAMDALHIACAHRWNANVFVSSDDRQLKAAQKTGLKTQHV